MTPPIATNSTPTGDWRIAEFFPVLVGLALELVGDELDELEELGLDEGLEDPEEVADDGLALPEALVLPPSSSTAVGAGLSVNDVTMVTKPDVEAPTAHEACPLP